MSGIGLTKLGSVKTVILDTDHCVIEVTDGVKVSFHAEGYRHDVPWSQVRLIIYATGA